jgi:hypothetical protein
MINRRPAPAQRPPDTNERRPSIVVAVRITLNLPAAGPVDVEVDESAALDDAMWRSEGVDAGHRHHSTADAGMNLDRRASTPDPPLDVADRRARDGRPPHVDTEVELIVHDGADVIARRRHASTTPPPAGSPISAPSPSTNDTAGWQNTGKEGRVPNRRIRRRTLIATAVAIVAILAALATAPPTPRRASTAAPPASVATGNVGAAATPSSDVTQDDCTGSTSTGQPDGTPRCTHRQGHLLPEPTSAITTSPCHRLLVSAAHIQGADPTTWMASLIDGGGEPGQTIDQAVQQQLVAARTARWQANHSDPEAIALRVETDSIIAEAGREPCSSTTCTSDRTEPDLTRRDNSGTRHAGWHWLCAP